MSLRTKLLLSLLPLAFALVGVGALSVHTARALGASSRGILQDNYRSVLACQRMAEALERIDAANALIALGERGPGLARRAGARARFEAGLQAQEGNITEAGEREATQALRQAWARCAAGMARLDAAAPEARRGLYFGELEEAFAAARDGAQRVLELNQHAMERKSNLALEEARRLGALLVLTTLVALLLGGVASSAFAGRLLRPLSVLAQAARRIGGGDLEARAVVAGSDELAQLAAAFNEMADRLRQYRQSSLGDLLQAQAAAQSAIDSLPDPVLVFDAAGALLSANRAAERDLKVQEEGPGGALARAEPALRAAVEAARAHVLAGRGALQPRGLEEAVRLPGPEGERYLLSRATPLAAPGGAVGGVTVVLQDVTRLRRFDELKNDLVATVAHEFRTPLTSLRMAIHLCLEGAAGPLSAKQADLLQAGREDCERLQAIVDDLLDLSRVQAGRVELSLRAQAASALIEAAVDAARSLAAERRVTARAEDLSAGAEVSVDPERLGLVFSNLLGNAVRYTPEGGEVAVRALATAEGVRFEVRDAGPGIPAEYRQRVFDKYFRVPGAPGGSAGLGLYIAREIVQAHAGRIGVESEVGRGSTFWFVLPRAAQPSS